MNLTTIFYDNLREGGTFGRAFRLWAEHMQSFGNPAGWAFMLFFGDPFIRFDIPNFECVIYTSLVGTKHEYKLYNKRIWRDKVFNKTTFGRFWVRFFYKTSPFIARLVVKSKTIRKLNRWFFLSILKFLEITPWNRKVKKFILEEERVKEVEITIPPIVECETCKKEKKS